MRVTSRGVQPARRLDLDIVIDGQGEESGGVAPLGFAWAPGGRGPGDASGAMHQPVAESARPKTSVISGKGKKAGAARRSALPLRLSQSLATFL